MKVFVLFCFLVVSVLGFNLFQEFRNAFQGGGQGIQNFLGGAGRHLENLGGGLADVFGQEVENFVGGVHDELDNLGETLGQPLKNAGDFFDDILHSSDLTKFDLKLAPYDVERDLVEKLVHDNQIKVNLGNMELNRFINCWGLSLELEIDKLEASMDHPFKASLNVGFAKISMICRAYFAATKLTVEPLTMSIRNLHVGIDQKSCSVSPSDVDVVFGGLNWIGNLVSKLTKAEDKVKKLIVDNAHKITCPVIMNFLEKEIAKTESKTPKEALQRRIDDFLQSDAVVKFIGEKMIYSDNPEYSFLTVEARGVDPYVFFSDINLLFSHNDASLDLDISSAGFRKFIITLFSMEFSIDVEVLDFTLRLLTKEKKLLGKGGQIECSVDFDGLRIVSSGWDEDRKESVLKKITATTLDAAVNAVVIPLLKMLFLEKVCLFVTDEIEYQLK